MTRARRQKSNESSCRDNRLQAINSSNMSAGNPVLQVSMRHAACSWQRQHTGLLHLIVRYPPKPCKETPSRLAAKSAEARQRQALATAGRLQTVLKVSTDRE